LKDRRKIGNFESMAEILKHYKRGQGLNKI